MPFGEYKDFADCVSKNSDKQNPEVLCAIIHKKVTGKYPSEKEGFEFTYRDSIEYMHRLMCKEKDKFKEEAK